MLPNSATQRIAPNITLTLQQAQGVQLAVQQWMKSSLISSAFATQLLSTIEVQELGFDWERLAKYSFRLSILCLAVAVASLIADRLFLKFIKRIVEIPPLLRAGTTALIAGIVHYQAYLRYLVHPGDLYLNEALHGIGAILFALADYQLGEGVMAWFATHSDSSGEKTPVEARQNATKASLQARLRKAYLPYLYLLLALVYAGVGFLTRSTFIWSVSFVPFAWFLGTQTSYSFLLGHRSILCFMELLIADRWGTYRVSISFPVKLVQVGLALIGIAYTFRRWEVTTFLWSPTRIWGMLYLFHALWVLSIWGNLNRVKYSWKQAQISRAIWSVLFLVAAVFSIWHGLRFADSTTKGFGLAFLGINFYTKACQYLWKALYKPLFFVLVAGSLAVIGKSAETVRI